MRRGMGLSVALLLLVSSNHVGATERKIYKCAGSQGVTVFSEKPCGDDAKEIGSINAGTGSSAQASGNALRDISDSVEDATCRREAEYLRNTNTSDQVDELSGRRDRLRVSLEYANNNLAGAVWEQGVRKEIGDLDMAIQQERMRLSLLQSQADTAARAALSECDARRAKREASRNP